MSNEVKIRAKTSPANTGTWRAQFQFVLQEGEFKIPKELLSCNGPLCSRLLGLDSTNGTETNVGKLVPKNAYFRYLWKIKPTSQCQIYLLPRSDGARTIG